MRRTLNVADRLVVGLAGTLLVAGGVIALLWWQRVTVVVASVERIDNAQIHSAPEQSWWGWSLLAVVASAALAGLWLLIANLRPNRVRRVRVGRSGGLGAGECGVSVPDVGKAAAKSLERHSRIRSTGSRAFTDSTTAVLEVAVTADPDAEGRDVTEICTVVRDQLARSVDGSGVEVRMLLHRAPNG